MLRTFFMPRLAQMGGQQGTFGQAILQIFLMEVEGPGWRFSDDQSVVNITYDFRNADDFMVH